jgi:hypothetical protein
MAVVLGPAEFVHLFQFVEGLFDLEKRLDDPLQAVVLLDQPLGVLAVLVPESRRADLRLEAPYLMFFAGDVKESSLRSKAAQRVPEALCRY